MLNAFFCFTIFADCVKQSGGRVFRMCSEKWHCLYYLIYVEMFHNDRVIFITHLYNRTNFKIKAKLCVDTNICSKLIVSLRIL